MSSYEVCPECGFEDLAFDEEHREVVCQACGAVLDAVDVTLEPELVRGSGQASDSGTREVPEGLEFAQARADELSSTQRRAIAVDQEIRRIANALGCPADVAGRARQLFDQAREAEITQGRVLEAWAGASLLAACRLLHLPRTIEDIAEVSRADEDEIRGAYKAIKRELELPVPPMMPQEYVSRLASKLDVPGPIEAQARELLEEISGTDQAAGKDPVGWACAALVIATRASGHEVSMNRAAQAGDVSDSTVRARVDDLEAMMESR